MRLPLRSLLLVAVAVFAAGASPAPRAASPCYDAAVVSLRGGATLHRYHARDGGVVRSNSLLSSPLLPGEDAVADGHGGWYIAGAGLAHLLADGRLDPRWHSPLKRDLQLWTLARGGGRLFVSDGLRVYAVGARSGVVLWRSAPVGGGSGKKVLAIVATPNTVYVGGMFKRFGGATRGQLVALSAASGRLLSWRPPPLKPYTPATSRSVNTLAVGYGRLYFAGSFSAVGGVPHVNGIAAVRLDDGRLTGFAPRKAGLGTLAIAVAAGGRVLVGGGDSGGIFDAVTGKLRKAGGIVGSAVALAVRDRTAYAGGSFHFGIGGYNLLAADVRTGEEHQWAPKIANEVGVATIALSGNRAFVGGQFCSTLG